MKTRSTLNWIILLILSISLTTSCNKEKLDGPVSQFEEADAKSTIEFNAIAQNDEFQVFCSVFRNNGGIYSFNGDDLTANVEVIESTKIELEPGDLIYCQVFTKTKMSYVKTAIKINGKVIKSSAKICTNSSVSYTVP